VISLGFRIAGWANIAGVLLFSLALTNERLISLSPVVFSRFGLISIMLWGAAYLSVAASSTVVPALVTVFALEKFIYAFTWVRWIQQHNGEMRSLFGASPLTASFYAIYGPLDFAFGLFFAYVAFQSFRFRSSAAYGSVGLWVWVGPA
jgi:hypothetical protein